MPLHDSEEKTPN